MRPVVIHPLAHVQHVLTCSANPGTHMALATISYTSGACQYSHCSTCIAITRLLALSMHMHFQCMFLQNTQALIGCWTFGCDHMCSLVLSDQGVSNQCVYCQNQFKQISLQPLAMHASTLIYFPIIQERWFM